MEDARAPPLAWAAAVRPCRIALATVAGVHQHRACRLVGTSAYRL